MTLSKTILIMAGGTGGHIFPALAVADMLRQQQHQVIWLGTPNSMEEQYVTKANIPFYHITISGLRGKKISTLLTAPARLSQALFQALKIIRRVKPDAILGMGGYASGPGGVAAKLLRIPLVIHEQNAVAGVTNKCLAHLANRVLEAFPDAFTQRYKPLLVGNPVRQSISALAEPAQRFAERGAFPIRFLILGGSQGALALNKIIPEALSLLAKNVTLEVWHQAGKHYLTECDSTYKSAKINAKVVPFIDDMAEAYSWADLVICRAGALTIAELAAAGIGSILIPFPQAVDDHQTKNALFLARAGAAEIISQNELTPTKLMTLLADKISDRNHLLSMANAARGLRNIDATESVARHCLEICHG